ncbi:hypothetical protein DFH08DRAFT_409234 [Mycena albidolilacea]|uniref:F-box domain-containing protein n=1 Tax=Mycena albidolilacea TaxID=1033008 RepID=A0AAD7EYI4_9AGAR|nr:hypothetical protein DFH08DRAFT_409234 [Mycena albidolilacea]
MCLPSHSSGWTFVVDEPRIRPSEAPLLVAGVCSRWREVAISTPRLCFSLDLDSNGKGDTEGVVSSWLWRAPPHPLSFTMLYRSLPRAVREISRHCENWNAVELRIPDRRPPTSSVRQSARTASSPHETLFEYRDSRPTHCGVLRRRAPIERGSPKQVRKLQ